jgi:hypothetical protein
LHSRLPIFPRASGGHWAPGIASHFVKQNAAIGSGTPRKRNCGSAKPERKIAIDRVGIFSGAIDLLLQLPSFVDFSLNNTFGIRVFNAEQEAQARQALAQCEPLIQTCQKVAAEKDPENYGNDPEVVQACGPTFQTCFLAFDGLYQTTGVSIYIYLKISNSSRNCCLNLWRVLLRNTNHVVIFKAPPFRHCPTSCASIPCPVCRWIPQPTVCTTGARCSSQLYHI